MKLTTEEKDIVEEFKPLINKFLKEQAKEIFKEVDKIFNKALDLGDVDFVFYDEELKPKYGVKD